MQAFYIVFKEEQNFSKKDLKALEEDFNLDTECNIIDLHNKGLSAFSNERHDENRIEDAVRDFLSKKNIEISELTFYEEEWKVRYMSLLLNDLPFLEGDTTEIGYN